MIGSQDDALKLRLKTMIIEECEKEDIEPEELADDVEKGLFPRPIIRWRGERRIDGFFIPYDAGVWVLVFVGKA